MIVVSSVSAVCRLLFTYYISTHLQMSVILQGEISVHNSSWSTVKATRCDILLCMVFTLHQELTISQEEQASCELEVKTEEFFVNVFYFCFDSGLVLGSNLLFHWSFKATIKRYFTLLSGCICTFWWSLIKYTMCLNLLHINNLCQWVASVICFVHLMQITFENSNLKHLGELIFQIFFQICIQPGWIFPDSF